jgi:uncharacterized Ntn-hydrolase superfamily protein
MFDPGFPINTFTVLGRCRRTGRLGSATTTREMAVGSRVPNVKAHVGAIATQASSDPRLGPLGLQLLGLGFTATRVMSELEANDPHIERRQLGIIDSWGTALARTGSYNSDWAGHIIGDGYIAMGNNLQGEHVAKAMAAALEDSFDLDLEVRLLHGLEAGTAAGGQHGGQRSAALIVYETESYPLMSLRVDDHPEPVADLRRIFDKFHPLLPYYRQRPIDPDLPKVYDWAKQQGIEL